MQIAQDVLRKGEIRCLEKRDEIEPYELKALLRSHKQLRSLMLELSGDMVVERGAYIEDGDLAGYYDTCALSSVKVAGELLVELAGWKRHPRGCGRRWFYKPPAEDK